jgi:glycosyltransferase involved in cell wall biosynthesis
MRITYLSYGNSSSDSGYATRIMSELFLVTEYVNPILINFGKDFELNTTADVNIKKKLELFSFKRHYLKPLFLFDLLRFIIQGKRIISQKNAKIIHAQGLYSAFMAIILKAIISQHVMVVFDIHGLVPQEFVWLKKGRRWGPAYLCLKIIERFCAAQSDYLLCASKSLKEYFEMKYKVNNKIDVIQNISTFPKRDLNELNKVKTNLKKQLNLKNAFVLLHVGSFLQWTDTARSIEIVKKLQEVLPKVFLLIVTYENKTKVSNFLLENQMLQSQFLVTHVPHEEIHQFVPVGDLGLIMRDNSLINQVAFPTKFSEYLACGVPILCSSSIQDVAQDVKKYGLGYVLTENALERDTFLGDVINEANLKKMRLNCIAYFAQELDMIKEKLQSIYTELSSHIDL